MTALSTRARYGSVAQSFHWLTVILVSAAYLTSIGGSEQQVYATATDAARQMHETIGVGVVAITLLRLFWRALDRTPESSTVAPWMRLSSRVVQIALYGLLIALPVTGILGAWWEGHAVTLYGFGNADPIVPTAHDLGQAVASLHTLLGNVILWLAGIHAAAAIFHHVVLRDRVLTTMLPSRS
jgi:cytochrome b561